MLLAFVPIIAMFLQIVFRCWAVVSVFLITVVSLWAQDEAAAPPAEETPDWVLPYTLMILFLALTLLILLRPLNRSDSAFSYDELKEQKEEEMKKLKGTH